MIVQNKKTKVLSEITEDGYQKLRDQNKHTKYVIIDRSPTFAEAGQKVEQKPIKIETLADVEALKMKFQAEIVESKNKTKTTKTTKK